MTHAEDTTGSGVGTMDPQPERRTARAIVRRDPRNPAAYWAARDADFRLGSSDIAALVRGDLWRIWNAKTGHPDAYDNDAMYWGRELEAAVARRTALDHPTWRIQQRFALLGHPRIPWMVCSPDRLIFRAEAGPGILECKTARYAWDTIPESYLAQCQWQMAVTGYPWTILAVLASGQDYTEYRLPADPAMQSALINLGMAFHARLVTGDPPDLDTSGAARRWLVAQYPRAVREEFHPASARLIAAAETYRALTDQIRDLADEKERLGVILRDATGEAKGLSWAGGRVT